MEILKNLIIIVASYLLGSLSMSIIMSRAVLGGDVRKKGSGNAGATNMARVYGMKAGALTLLGDVAKAAAAMFIGWLLLGEKGMCLGGVVSLLGHCFPIYYGFKGGKGVSVGAAIALALDWRVAIIAVLSFVLFAVVSKKVSLGSICAALSIMISSVLLGLSEPKLFMALTAPVLVIFQHRENIKRLFKGTEPDFKAAKAPKKDNAQT